MSRFEGDWKESVNVLLGGAGLGNALKGLERVIIKPNLVEAIKPPVTTPVGLTAAIVDYIKDAAPHVEPVVAEGTGAADYETPHTFRELGYETLAREKGLRLVDLNVEPLVELSNPALTRWPVIYLPKIVMESFVISVPVLKAHSLSVVTLSMKNMMGAAPPAHYQQGGHWKKSAFHTQMHESVLDLNRYCLPDFSIIDATVGLRDYHLGGAECDPHPGLLVAGSDPVAVDAYGAGLLKKDWREIGHIREAHNELGSAGPLKVVPC